MASAIGVRAPATPLLFTTADAAVMLGVGKTKLFELFASGRLQSVLLDGRRLVPADALDELVASLRREQCS